MLKRTALFEEHRKLGGRLIDFGGWELPVQYSGVMDEHNACRKAVGLFDVSHMGEVHVEGPEAEAYLNYLVSNNVSRIATNQAQYSIMCNEHGGIVDDLVIYRRAADRFLVVVNASNVDKDFFHMTEVAKKFPSGLKVTNESARYTQIAIQGRFAARILQTLTETPLAPIKNYWFSEGFVLGAIPAILARTGYTGEDGFEVYVPWEKGPEVWRALMVAGQPFGIKPCGLGARDTLRLEMKYPLYGHELTEETNAIESGSGWVTKLDKADFVGRAAILRAREAGLKRALVGITLSERGIPRQGYTVHGTGGGAPIGIVTSGTQSPSTGKAIAIAYVPVASSAVGTKLSIEIRGTHVAASVVPTPFYKRDY